MPSCCQNCHLGYQNSRKILYKQMQHGFEMLNIDFVFCQCHPKSQNWHFYDLRSQIFSISLPFFFLTKDAEQFRNQTVTTKEGQEAACNFGNTTNMLLFGVVQIVLSQIPEFRNIQWLSILATAMSFTYSSIRLGLGLAKVRGMLVNSLEYYLANDSTSN